MNIIFYGRERMGAVVLLYLLAKRHTIKVIQKDDIVGDVADCFNLKKISFNDLKNEKFDLLVCCHGRRILSNDILNRGLCINIHPCLYKYKGKDPIKRYMENKDTEASVGCHIMINKVDEGKVLSEVFFETPIINSYGEFYNLAIPYYIKCIDNVMKEMEV